MPCLVSLLASSLPIMFVKSLDCFDGDVMYIGFFVKEVVFVWVLVCVMVMIEVKCGSLVL